MSIKQLTIDFLKLFGVFLIMIVLFFSLTVLTYLLPKDKIKHNAAFAVTNFNAEKASYAKYSPFFEVDGALHDSVKLDNYTDTLILGVAVANIDENLNIFEKAIYNFKYKEASVGAEKRYEQIFTENRKADAEYIRYWFGNLTVIKPLLVFLSYQSIRYLNMLLIFTLLFFAVYLIAKKINIKYALAYFISMLLCQIFIIPMSLQFTPVFLITLISSIVILLLYKKKYFNKLLPYMFLLIGGLTAFFDLLTVPLLTFGFPMILVMLLRNKYEKCTFKENLLLLIKLGAIWCVSYGMTYLAKWIIASIILGQNEIANAWEQFLFRTNADNEYNRFDAIHKNFALYFNKFILIGLIIFMIIYTIIVIRKKYYKNINYKNIIILLLIGIIPYLWYIVVSNHSSIHYWMTYRIQAISMMALLSSILSIPESKPE